MNFSGFQKDATQVPPGLIRLAPSAFVADWQGRPKEPITVGLRFLAVEDITYIRGEAAQRAAKIHKEPNQEFVDCFNDALLELLAARALCSAENACEAYFQIEEHAKQALRPETLQAVFDAYDRLRVEFSPVEPEATEEEIAELEMLAIRVLPTMATHDAARIRRLLGHCLIELQKADPDADVTP